MAEICQKYEIPKVDVYSDIIKTSNSMFGIEADESMEGVKLPRSSDLALWLAEAVEYFDEYKSTDFDYEKVSKDLLSHREEINEATEYAEIWRAYINTDGGATYFEHLQFNEGEYSKTYVDEYYWNYEEQDIRLWELLRDFGADAIDELLQFAEEEDLTTNMVIYIYNKIL